MQWGPQQHGWTPASHYPTSGPGGGRHVGATYGGYAGLPYPQCVYGGSAMYPTTYPYQSAYHAASHIFPSWTAPPQCPPPPAPPSTARKATSRSSSYSGDSSSDDSSSDDDSESAASKGDGGAVRNAEEDVRDATPSGSEDSEGATPGGSESRSERIERMRNDVDLEAWRRKRRVAPAAVRRVEVFLQPRSPPHSQRRAATRNASFDASFDASVDASDASSDDADSSHLRDRRAQVRSRRRAASVQRKDGRCSRRRSRRRRSSRRDESAPSRTRRSRSRR